VFRLCNLNEWCQGDNRYTDKTVVPTAPTQNRLFRRIAAGDLTKRKVKCDARPDIRAARQPGAP
jgi:hypothetical protein